MPKLSPVMVRSLATIVSAGGEAHPEQGGWWHPKPFKEEALDNPRLEIETGDYRGRWTVGTLTIRSLADRGLLVIIPETGNHKYCAYRVTDAGRSAALSQRETKHPTVSAGSIPTSTAKPVTFTHMTVAPFPP